MYALLAKVPPKAEAKRDFSYKDVHLDLYRENKLQWPPSLDDPRYSHIHWGSLGRRACEVVLLFDHMFPAAARKEGLPIIEFVDVNPDVKRTLVQTSSGEYKSPWRSHPMTLVGSSQIVVRVFDKDGVSIRQLTSSELFALCGWFPSSFKVGVPLPDVVAAASLCGNSFSAYHLGPIIMALFGIVSTAPCAKAYTDILRTDLAAAQAASSSDGDEEFRDEEDAF
jgi:hypothetical protein